jgi:uncharacterized membrane protein
MTPDEEIRQLQDQLNRLKQELHMQHQKLNEIQQRLIQLGSTERIVAKRQSTGPSWSLENFIGLRIIHFIGIIVLVIGLSIGVKYAIDSNLISERTRIILAYVAGIVLFIISIRLRKNYKLFSAILYSGAMASLYFTTYGAYVYYNMFSFPVAFAMMIALTVYTVYEAISYNSEEVALLGLVGAYGIPFLISKNADRADLFFLYISLINIGVSFLCIRKTWKNVGRVAQTITWMLFIGWASMRYNVKLQFTALGFMVFFFLLFLFQNISFKLLNKKPFTINDTYQLVLHNLAVYIASLFIFGYSFSNSNVAMITLVLSALVAAEALVLYNLWKDERLTSRMMASLALTFFIVFIGFNWDGFSVTLLWLLVAVIIFAWGFKMKSVQARMTAIILIGVTLAKLLAVDSLNFTTVQKVIAYLVLGVLLLIVSFFYQKFRQKIFEEE